MRVPFLLWSLPLTAAGGFVAAKICRPEIAPPQSASGRANPGLIAAPHAKALPVFKETGSRGVPEMFTALAKATPADLRRMALGLLADPRRRRDLGLWGPLLARWSEVDGAGLLLFARREAPPGERPWLEAKSWFAWGAANPLAASAEGRELPVLMARELIAGMAKRDPKAAAAFALQMPDAQFNLFGIAADVAASEPELIATLLPRAVYDGMRQPLLRAQAAALVTTHPAAALALARKAGNLGHDPVPDTMRHIAQHDPVKAAELLAQMPSSRSKALSSVALAKTWAARDGEAATAWARQSLTGPVKQAALLEIAASSGGPDPHAALQLVEEAGWSQETNFHAIAGYGNTHPSEVRDRPTPAKTAGLLLQQLALLNPAAAQTFLEQRVPVNLRAAVAKHAGFAAAP